MTDADAAKQAAAVAAVALVQDGMRLGLGTGSTVDFALVALAERIRQEGLSVVGIPTSERTAARSRELGIPLTDFAATETLDLAIDGADEVQTGTLAMIKGLGGALLREKIVAGAAVRFIGIVDPSKVVEQLGMWAPLPVEVAQFGHHRTARQLTALGGAPVLRLHDGAPLITDGGNVIYDCRGFAPIRNAHALAATLDAVAGVMGHGLFLDMAEAVMVGDPVRGTITLRRLA